MKIELREHEIELIAETDFERDALAKIHRARGAIRIKDGRTTSTSWPPSDRLTNVVIVLPDPNKW